jgi:hypothetical protein
MVTVARIGSDTQVTNQDRRFGTAAEAAIAAGRQLEEGVEARWSSRDVAGRS